MRITYRLVAAICLTVLVVIAAFAYLQIREERARLVRDLERRAALLAEGLKEAVGPVMGGRSTAPIERILKRFGRPNQVVAVYDPLASPIAVVPESAAALIPSLPEISEALMTETARQGFRQLDDRRVYVYATPLSRNDRPAGVLAVFLDAGHLVEAERALWRYNAIRFVVLAVVLSGITVPSCMSPSPGRWRAWPSGPSRSRRGARGRRPRAPTQACSAPWRTRCPVSPGASTARSRPPSRKPPCVCAVSRSGRRSGSSSS